jgi:hypothetical protein
MKLDPRIKSLSDILTCFDIERAEQFIGQRGYFADTLYCFDDLGSCYHGTLTDACDGQAGPFHRRDDRSYKQFFIPESSLKPIEKKYRPYTLEEFMSIFPIGEPIKFRAKAAADKMHLQFVLVGYREYGEGANIYIGTYPFTLNELFEEYEWHEDATGDWVPFGAEVEE